MPEDSPKDSPEDRAASLLEEAKSAAAGGPGGLERAAALLREAWALSPSLRVACNRGRIAFRREEMREAVEFLSICVAKTPAARSAEQRARDKRIEEALAVALKKVGALSVQGSEPGATEQVATEQPAAPQSLPAAVPAAVPAAPPPADCPPAPGPTPLRASPAALKMPVSEPVRASSVVAAVGLGGSGVALGTGAVFSVLRGAASGQATRDMASSTMQHGTCWSPSCGAEKSLADQRLWGDAMAVSFITAGALAAGAVTLWLITESRAPKPRPVASGRFLTVGQW